jgi:hypothetical protein
MNSIEWLIDQMISKGYFDGNKPLSFTNLDHLQQQAKEMEMDNAIAFHKWMKREDHVINSEKYFHYSDKDMYNEYLKHKDND